MKTSMKAFLIGLMVFGAGPALAQQDQSQQVTTQAAGGATATATATGASPINFLDADVSVAGKASFSGLGTGTASTQTGTSQSVNVGLSSALSANTSVESSPGYQSSGAITATVAEGDWNQTVGVTSKVLDNNSSNVGGGQTTTTDNTANDMITGNFVGKITTSNTVDTDDGTSESTSGVDLAGVSSISDVDLKGSSVVLTSAARDLGNNAPGVTGTGAAAGNIATSTNASAGITSSSFSNGFIQTFSPATDVQKGVLLITGDDS
jgi:hypothetical protein